jgi:hypothetical protein
MSTITIEKIEEQLKGIDTEFQRVTKIFVQARDEQIRLRGEFDGLTKLKAEIEKKEVKDG